MPDGFGGALAAPIWHDYMQAASNGYCGDFPPPTIALDGTAFFGPLAVTGNPGARRTTAATPATQANTGNTGNGGPTQYHNPTLYQQPPQGGSKPGSGNRRASAPATTPGGWRGGGSGSGGAGAGGNGGKHH